MFRLIGVDDDQREIVRVDRSGPDGAVTHRHGCGAAARRRPILFQGDGPPAAGQIYVSPVSLDRSDGGSTTPHVPMLRLAHADLRTRRQDVRHPRSSTSTCGRAFDHVRAVGAARRAALSSSTPAATISFIPTRPANSARSSATPASWRGDFPSLAPRSARRTASRWSPRTRPAVPAEWRSRRRCWPATEWVGVIETCRTRFSWRPRSTSGTPRCWSG